MRYVLRPVVYVPGAGIFGLALGTSLIMNWRTTVLFLAGVLSGAAFSSGWRKR